jgi:hypothetical protein
VEGVVQAVKQYGVFVDIGAGRTALLHCKNISDNRVAKAQKVFAQGDKITVSRLAREGGGRGTWNWSYTGRLAVSASAYCNTSGPQTTHPSTRLPPYQYANTLVCLLVWPCVNWFAVESIRRSCRELVSLHRRPWCWARTARAVASA